MLNRYFELLEFVDREDETLADLVPSASENKKLKALLRTLERVQSVSLQLQTDAISLWAVRVLFDALLAEKPALSRYLGATGAIVASPDFESACVKVQLDKQHLMSRQEKKAVQPFLRHAATTQPATASSSKQKESFAASILKKARLESEKNSYALIKTIPPTSNIAERHFSVARATYGLHRHSLLPVSVEVILFLRVNKSYWDATTVHECID